MKYFIFILSVMVIISPISAGAGDITSGYMERCALRRDQPFCQCALTAFSDRIRKSQKAYLTSLEENEGNVKKRILSGSVMTEEKIAAVCELHNIVADYDRQASMANSVHDDKAYAENIAKKREFFEKEKILMASYNVSHQISGALIGGGYCDNRVRIAQIKKDQAEDEGGVYSTLHRGLSENPFYMYRQIMSAGTRAQCHR